MLRTPVISVLDITTPYYGPVRDYGVVLKISSLQITLDLTSFLHVVTQRAGHGNSAWRRQYAALSRNQHEQTGKLQDDSFVTLPVAPGAQPQGIAAVSIPKIDGNE